MEKRGFVRSITTFPVELKIKDLSSTHTLKLNGKTIDISEGGIKIVSHGLLSLPATIYINLPPCYSDDPTKAKGIEADIKLIWSRPMTTKGKFIYGFCFLDIDERNKNILRKIIKYEIEKSTKNIFSTTKPAVDIHREPHSCNMYAVDLTIGCESGCKYCYFSKLQQNKWQKKYPLCEDFPIPVDLSPIYEMKKIPDGVVYLSPSSDPFGAYAKELTHELLAFFLPRGVKFAISTKNIIPEKTTQLLKQYLSQVEVEIGITNLSRERNDTLEKGCPTTEERLEHLFYLVTQKFNPGVRMDPLFPVIDDNITSLEATIKAISKTGTRYITTAYLFTFGRTLRQLRKESFLKDSLEHLTEKCYVAGGKSFSVTLERKKQTFEIMDRICKVYGIKFSVCGCKDVRLRDTGYPLVCRRILH